MLTLIHPDPIERRVGFPKKDDISALIVLLCGNIDDEVR